jgi:hypothetical protein
MVEFGEIKNLMDVLTQYEILEFLDLPVLKTCPIRIFIFVQS